MFEEASSSYKVQYFCTLIIDQIRQPSCFFTNSSTSTGSLFQQDNAQPNVARWTLNSVDEIYKFFLSENLPDLAYGTCQWNMCGISPEVSWHRCQPGTTGMYRRKAAWCSVPALARRSASNHWWGIYLIDNTHGHFAASVVAHEATLII